MQDTRHLPNPTGYNKKKAVIGTSIYRDDVTYVWESLNEAAVDMGVADNTVKNSIINGVDLNGYILTLKEET